MKIKNIIVTMAASLSLPLAGAYARVASPPDDTSLQSGSGAHLPGQAADEGALEPARKNKKKSKKSKKSKKKKSKSPS